MGYAKEQIAEGYKHHGRAMAGLAAIEEVAKALDILDEGDDLRMEENRYDYKTGKFLGPQLTLQPWQLRALAVATRSLTAIEGDFPNQDAPTLAEVGRILLSRVGTWDKSFDEERNVVQIVGTYMGVRLVIEDTPPSTCTVRKVEEEVAVPEKVIPAHTEKKVRWVMEGDCNPLMAPVAVMAEPGDAAAAGDENNPPDGHFPLDKESVSDV